MTSAVPSKNVFIKRAYEPAAPEDGARILIDRLWPRGIKKEALALAEWEKDLSPSNELRQWFGHEPAKWEEFRRRYAAELREHGQEAFELLHSKAQAGVVTLIFGAHNEQQNNAVAMREFLLNPKGLDATY